MMHYFVLALRFLFWMMTESFITLLALFFYDLVFKRIRLYFRICKERKNGVIQPVSNYQREMDACAPVLDIGVGNLSLKENMLLGIKSIASLLTEYKTIFVIALILGTLQAVSFVLTPEWREGGMFLWKGQGAHLSFYCPLLLLYVLSHAYQL
ncbi:hypothetical protein [Bartonella raoultii]|uniref:Uncharacterized protein n=1 Tax=Bartonella raoultii TaxID=1457020 RepID=A0ABS7IA25_9HYPH|nr:hypothetical protein [Bartonella raoultii]MBX4336492.1 hypothetical protein [Bartonella raoultii]